MGLFPVREGRDKSQPQTAQIGLLLRPQRAASYIFPSSHGFVIVRLRNRRQYHLTCASRYLGLPRSRSTRCGRRYAGRHAIGNSHTSMAKITTNVDKVAIAMADSDSGQRRNGAAGQGIPAVGDGEGYCPRRQEDRRRNRRKVSGITRPRTRIKAGMSKFTPGQRSARRRGA